MAGEEVCYVGMRRGALGRHACLLARFGLSALAAAETQWLMGASSLSPFRDRSCVSLIRNTRSCLRLNAELRNLNG